MDLADVLRRRRMVRSYDPARPVSGEALEACLAAATRAPSAGFTQGVSLLVLTTEVDRSRFWEATAVTGDRWATGMRTAPVLLGVWTSQERYLERYAEPDKRWTGRDADRWSAPYWYVDAGMAAMAILLTAVDRGLGACFFGVPPGRIGAVRDAFGVPPDQLNVGVVSLGYAAAGGAAGSPTRRARKRPEELVHRGRWADRTG